MNRIVPIIFTCLFVCSGASLRADESKPPLLDAPGPGYREKSHPGTPQTFHFEKGEKASPAIIEEFKKLSLSDKVNAINQVPDESKDVFLKILNQDIVALSGSDAVRLNEIETKSGVSYNEIASALASSLKWNRYYSKGRVGIVSGDVFIAVEAEKNTLLLGKHNQEWVGADKNTKQTVLVFHEAVVDQNNLPKDFELSGSILISFEIKKVIFFDFSTFQGGYYLRD